MSNDPLVKARYSRPGQGCDLAADLSPVRLVDVYQHEGGDGEAHVLGIDGCAESGDRARGARSRSKRLYAAAREMCARLASSLTEIRPSVASNRSSRRSTSSSPAPDDRPAIAYLLPSGRHLVCGDRLLTEERLVPTALTVRPGEYGEA